MTRHLTRTRAGLALLVVVTLVVAGLRLASAATTTTTAAWTDDVHATTGVALGTWSTAGFMSCEVRYDADDTVVPGSTCTATVTVTNWVGGWNVGNPITGFQGQIRANPTYPGDGQMTPNSHVHFGGTFEAEPSTPRPGGKPDWTRAQVTLLRMQKPPVTVLSMNCSGIAQRQLSGEAKHGTGSYFVGFDVEVSFTGTTSPTCPAVTS